MKIKLSFGSPEYFVNESNKTVTCKLSFRLNPSDGTRYNSYCHALLELSDAVLKEEESIRDRWTVAETAKLDPADTFDVETGKKVARAKAESSAYKFMANKIAKVINGSYNVIACACEEFIEKAAAVKNHNDEYLSQF
jgi:hypothetical protein